MSFRANLTQAMIDKDMRPVDVASKLGDYGRKIHPTTVDHWLRDGGSMPVTETALALGEMFDMTVEELFA